MLAHDNLQESPLSGQSVRWGYDLGDFLLEFAPFVKAYALE